MITSMKALDRERAHNARRHKNNMGARYLPTPGYIREELDQRDDLSADLALRRAELERAEHKLGVTIDRATRP